MEGKQSGKFERLVRPGRGLRLLPIGVLVLIAVWVVYAIVDRPTDVLTRLGQVGNAAFFPLWYIVPVCVIAVLTMIRSHRIGGVDSYLGRAVILLTASAMLWSIGDLVWFVYDTCRLWPVATCSPNLNPQTPSWADVFYVLMYPTAIVGLVWLGRGIGARWSDMRPRLVLGIPLLLATVIILLPDHALMGIGLGAASAGMHRIGPILVALYLIGDALVLLVAATLVLHTRRVQGGLFHTPVQVMVGSFGMLYLADSLFYVGSAVSSEPLSYLSALFYAVGLICTVSAGYALTTVHGALRGYVSSQRGRTVDAMAAAIVDAHAELLGDTAREIAGRTPGILVESGDRVRVVSDDYEGTLRRLVARFERTAGPLSLDISRAAAAAAAKDAGSSDEQMAFLVHDGSVADELATPREFDSGAATLGALLLVAAAIYVYLVTQRVDLSPDDQWQGVLGSVLAVGLGIWLTMEIVLRRSLGATIVGPFVFTVAMGLWGVYTGGFRSDLRLMLLATMTWAAVYSGRRIQILLGLANVGCLIALLNSSRAPHYDLAVAYAAVALIVTVAVSSITRALRTSTDELGRANASLGLLLGDIWRTREDERHRIAAELHDFPLQTLIAARMHLSGVRRSNDVVLTADGLSETERLLGVTVDALRRIIGGLEPRELMNEDLGTAVRAFAADLSAVYGIRVDVAIDDVRLGIRVRLALYRLIAEAATNAAKHSRSSELLISVTRRKGILRAVVADKGVGFDATQDETGMRGVGMGMRLMRQQVSAIGGTLLIDSGDAGTAITFELPVTRTGKLAR